MRTVSSDLAGLSMRVLKSKGLPVCLSIHTSKSVQSLTKLDDPTLQPIFHPLHGLITLHSFPHSQLLPPTIKHSSLLGLSSGGGGSENNLGFRARRKRWGVETVHLGIDGGVGERRTEPAPEVARVVSATPTPVPHPSETSEGVEKASIPVSNTTKDSIPDGGEVKVKKEKRARVRFGEDQVLEAPAVSSNLPKGQDHSHGHDGHDHDHSHGHGHRSGQAPTPRATVRHDRPDLYEF
jgi:elongator complex protein 4